MTAVLLGFVSLAAVVGVGYLLARRSILAAGSDAALSRLTFYAATPALMLLTVADADVGAVFSSGAAVTAGTAATLAVAYAVIARTLLGRRGAELTLGAYAASYVNAGNLGIPILVFAVGSAAAIAPVLLFQLLVMVPVGFTILDRQTGRRGVSRIAAVATPLRNPLVLGVGGGLLLALTGWELPTVVHMPVRLLADMAVPVMLIAFGASLRGAPVPGRHGTPGPLWLVVLLKNLVGPALAYVLAGPVLGLSGAALLGPVVVAALPTAQNVFVYAMRYGRAIPLARDAVLLTTAVCVPVVVTLSAVVR